MLLPDETDAPIYHWPIATSAMCIVSVYVFWTECDSSFWIQSHPDLLHFGRGLQPFQWLAYNFLHFDVAHLVGNMYFLWLFGYIVEGKIGWWRFLLVYLGIGILEGAIVQTLMLGAAEGGALGASGGIFGLMAICVIWAPINEFQCYWIWGGVGVPARMASFNIPVGFFCLGHIFLNFIGASVREFEMSSEVLHLVGAAIGLSVGLVMLRKNWVDCDKWDLFSVIAGRNQTPDDEVIKKDVTAELLRNANERPSDQFYAQQIAQLILEEKWSLAYAAWSKAVEDDSEFALLAGNLNSLITHFLKFREPQPAIRLMKNYIRFYEDRAIEMRLLLAKALLSERQQPAFAHRLLLQIRDQTLSSEQRELWKKLIRRAALRKEGQIELRDSEEH